MLPRQAIISVVLYFSPGHRAAKFNHINKILNMFKLDIRKKVVQEVQQKVMPEVQLKEYLKCIQR